MVVFSCFDHKDGRTKDHMRPKLDWTENRKLILCDIIFVSGAGAAAMMEMLVDYLNGVIYEHLT